MRTPTSVAVEGRNPWPTFTLERSPSEMAATSGTQRCGCPASTDPFPPICQEGCVKKLLTPPPLALPCPIWFHTCSPE